MSDGAYDRQKSEFWGYAHHERDVRDVVDEETWQTELEWAIEESLAYARTVERPSSVTGARICTHRNFLGHFEAMLDDLLHKPLDICTASETVQNTTQTKLGGDGR
jgi:hypothetical protein